MSNAIREGNPLSGGHCVHAVPMSEHCEGCEMCEEPSADYLKGFKDGQASRTPALARGTWSTDAESGDSYWIPAPTPSTDKEKQNG